MATPPTTISPTDTDELWRQLTDGLTDSWLDEIRELRVEGDCVERSLDLWSIALAAQLKNDDRRETASCVLARLVRLSDDDESADD